MSGIEIASKKGDVSDYVDAEITKEGDLRLTRNSFGPGDSETEVIAAVDKDDKDRLLMELLKELYSGNTSAVDDFTTFAESKGITVNRSRWP